MAGMWLLEGDRAIVFLRLWTLGCAVASALPVLSMLVLG